MMIMIILFLFYYHIFRVQRHCCGTWEWARASASSSCGTPGAMIRDGMGPAAQWGAGWTDVAIRWHVEICKCQHLVFLGEWWILADIGDNYGMNIHLQAVLFFEMNRRVAEFWQTLTHTAHFGTSMSCRPPKDWMFPGLWNARSLDFTRPLQSQTPEESLLETGK